MVDKNYCMSSYLAFRFIEKDDVDFYEGLHHKNPPAYSDAPRTPVHTAEDMDKAIQNIFDKYWGVRLGILLSGGMDSATLAAYMPGCDAYTFRFLGGSFGEQELKCAEFYADFHKLNLHYVDIDWDTIDKNLDLVMRKKASPVQAIDPQLYEAAKQAKNDGVEVLITGEGGDFTFGGMDKILSREWQLEDFEKFYTFIDPAAVLKEPVDMSYVYERFRKGEKIDYMRFLEEIYSVDSTGSFLNAFQTANIDCLRPFTELKLADPLDINRVRNGDSKYLIRELFSMKYSGNTAPDKVPMPRPVDMYFNDWSGPTRSEFKDELDMDQFTGNQKWQLYCLERFLNCMEPKF